MYVKPYNHTPNPQPQNPKPNLLIYGQMIRVNKIYYSYLHVLLAPEEQRRILYLLLTSLTSSVPLNPLMRSPIPWSTIEAIPSPAITDLFNIFSSPSGDATATPVKMINLLGPWWKLVGESDRTSTNYSACIVMYTQLVAFGGLHWQICFTYPNFSPGWRGKVTPKRSG